MAPTPDAQSLFEFVGTSVGAALLGGWHCAGMCGPLATLASTPRDLFLYQVGRWLSYASLGALAGLFGNQLLGWIPSPVRWALSLILAVFAFWTFTTTWRTQGSWAKKLFERAHAQSHFARPLALGLLNGLLPCSLLLTFLFVAAGLGAPIRGVVLMTCLWAGSLPWLLGFSWVGKNLRPLASKNPWIERILLGAVLLGLIAQNLPHD